MSRSSNFAQGKDKAEDNSEVEKKQKKSLWKRFSLMKWRWKILGLVVIVGLGWFGYYSYSQQKKIEANREVVMVTREDLVREAVRTGKVELQGVVSVRPPLSGVLTELAVTNGQVVNENEVLFKVKAVTSEAQQAAAWERYVTARNTYEDAKIMIGNTEWANFEGAKQNVIAAEQTLEKFEKDFPDKKKADNKEYQVLVQALKVARLNVEMQVNIPARIGDRLEQARASYLAASAAYKASKDGTYKSPITGKIENLGVNVGENVLADVGDKEGTPLFLIVPAGKRTVSMHIGVNDAATLQVGQMATVKTTSLKGLGFSAQIVRVDKVGKTSNDGGLTYRAWLEIDDESDKLLLGVPVEVTIKIGESINTLVVPSLAVVEGMVTVVNEAGEILEKRAVEVGLKSLGKTEILSGLSEGERVLVDHNSSK
jgi:multidrug efflux pump subunit AcrA (membrane-fusion protein)